MKPRFKLREFQDIVDYNEEAQNYLRQYAPKIIMAYFRYRERRGRVCPYATACLKAIWAQEIDHAGFEECLRGWGYDTESE